MDSNNFQQRHETEVTQEWFNKKFQPNSYELFIIEWNTFDAVAQWLTYHAWKIFR